jgi:hypothetical protein
VDPSLAARLPFEVLHHVGDINLLPLDAGFLQGPVHYLSRGTDEWLAAQIFRIARLFAYQQHSCVPWPFSEDSLGRLFIKRASRAVARRPGYLPKARCVGNGSGPPLIRSLVSLFLDNSFSHETHASRAVTQGRYRFFLKETSPLVFRDFGRDCVHFKASRPKNVSLAGEHT